MPTIHPGYGFLSESNKADFSNIGIFVGLDGESIAAMGSIEAKPIAQQLEIPTVPGYNGDAQEPANCSEAEKIGFPSDQSQCTVVAWGMRIVHQARNLAKHWR